MGPIKRATVSRPWRRTQPSPAPSRSSNRLVSSRTLAEEMWQRLGHETLVAETPWPEVDDSLLEEDTVTVAVQVNGKLRGTVRLPKDIDRESATSVALDLDNVVKAIGGRPVRRVIVVPNRIINVVV